MFRNFLPLNPRKLLAGLLLAVLASFLWTPALLSSQNILFANENWLPYSVSFGRMMINGYELLMGRQSIAYGTLHFGGFGRKGRLVTRKKWEPEKIIFTARLQKSSTISVMTTEDGKKFSALRLSTNSVLPSQYYEFDEHETFTLTRPFTANIPADQNLKIEIENGPGALTVLVNGQKIAEVAGHFPAGFIGVEASTTSTIKGPSVIERGKETGLPFERDSFWPYFFMNLGIAAVIALFLPIKAILVLALSGGLWLSYDYFDYSRKLFLWNHQTLSFEPAFKEKVDIEPVRQKFFNGWYSLLGGKIPSREEVEKEFGRPQKLKSLRYSHGGIFEEGDPRNTVYPPASAKTHRLMIIGGSMDVGTGVSSLSEAYDVKLSRLLKIEVLNASESMPFLSSKTGANLLRIIDSFHPDIVLLDLYMNVLNKKILVDFIHAVQEKNIPLVLSRPPFNVLSIDEELWKRVSHYSQGPLGGQNFPGVRYYRHEDKLAQFVKENKLIFLDTNRAFTTKEVFEKGNLFWDYIHLSDTGHTILSEFFAKELIKLSVFPGP